MAGGPHPRTLVAVTTGGFSVGAWDVTGVDDIADGGFYRFAFDGTRTDLVGYRVKVTQGPVARWLEPGLRMKSAPAPPMSRLPAISRPQVTALDGSARNRANGPLEEFELPDDVPGHVSGDRRDQPVQCGARGRWREHAVRPDLSRPVHVLIKRGESGRQKEPQVLFGLLHDVGPPRGCQAITHASMFLPDEILSNSWLGLGGWAAPSRRRRGRPGSRRLRHGHWEVLHVDGGGAGGMVRRGCRTERRMTGDDREG